MQIIRCGSVSELNERATELVINDLKSRPKSLFCTATGNSPTGIYQLLAQKKDAFNASGLTLLKLDEWHHLPMDHPASCEHYIKQYLLGPLNVAPENFIGFDSMAEPAAECERINAFLLKNSPVDLCMLGLGQNGHLGFNEPADFLQPRAHLSTLSPTSLNHSMIKGSGADVKYGFTLGIADILQSKKIVLPVFGQNKKAIMDRLMDGTVYPQLPASFLWLHPDMTCFYCENDN